MKSSWAKLKARNVTYTVNVKWLNLTEEVAKIIIFQLVNFDYFLMKNDYFVVTFNYSSSNLKLTIRNSQIWLKNSS